MINHIHLGKIERRNRRCSTGFIKQLEDIGIKDVPEVGGKNASLGEMIQNLAPKGMKIPGGFVVTASAYRYFLEKSEIRNSLLRSKSPEGHFKSQTKFRRIY